MDTLRQKRLAAKIRLAKTAVWLESIFAQMLPQRALKADGVYAISQN